MDKPPFHGRGTDLNPANRFERVHVQWDPADPDQPAARTQFYWDDARSIITTNDSPDIPFRYAINPYRGCEHGCAYCYARPYHEYLGLSAGLDFETRIFVKRDAARLLRLELMKPSWQPEWISISGVTDAYQPAESRLRVTRSILEVLAEFRQPVGLITKNALVTRDIDLLASLASHGAAAVSLSITTLDETLRRALEPRTSTAARRLAAVRALAGAGIPVCVNVAPIIPGLNDHEIPAILRAAREAGAVWAGMTVLRLPHAVAEIFTRWLHENVPARAEKVLRRVRELRGGALNESRFGDRMRGKGARADQIARMFELAAARAGFEKGKRPILSAAAFRRPGDTRQMFEG